MVNKYNVSEISSTGLIGITDTVVNAVPSFFPILIFIIWILGTLIIYVSNMKASNEKNIKGSLLAMSFVCFILSLIISSLNTTTITYLSYYWIIFYIVAIGFIYLLIDGE